eukprot:603003-Amorphochlora_amoeboformis.AAC.2
MTIPNVLTSRRSCSRRTDQKWRPVPTSMTRLPHTVRQLALRVCRTVPEPVSETDDFPLDAALETEPDALRYNSAFTYISALTGDPFPEDDGFRGGGETESQENHARGEDREAIDAAEIIFSSPRSISSGEGSGECKVVAWP